MDGTRAIAARNGLHMLSANIGLRREAISDDAPVLHARQARLHLRVIEAQAVQNTRAAVMAGGMEARVAERRHQVGQVLRHGPFGLVGGLRFGRRHPGVAVAAQVGHYERKAIRQHGGHFVPHEVRFGIAVDQQQGRPPVVGPNLDMDARGADIDVAADIA